MPLLYLIGSLHNPQIPIIAATIRKTKWDVFDDWYAAGPEADVKWREYEIQRGHSYVDAVRGRHACEILQVDKKYLDKADAGLLVLPAGRSGHLELGYLVGRNAPTYILLDKEYETWDIMLGLATAVWDDLEAVLVTLEDAL